MLKNCWFCLVILAIYLFKVDSFRYNNNAHLLGELNRRIRSNSEYESSVYGLISRVIGGTQDASNFVVNIVDKQNDYELDKFSLEMIDNNEKLKITANSAVAASWGFNYYLKYYARSSVVWSGRNINLKKTNLPIVKKRVKITAND